MRAHQPGSEADFAMVLQTCIQEWAARLAELRRDAAEEPDGSRWLWTIRIRILRYLLSRYAETPPEAKASEPPLPAQRTSASPAVHITTEAGPSLHRPAAARFADVDAPPKMRETFSPVLETINVINTDVRVRLGHDPAPDAAWHWWRETHGLK